MADFTPGPWTLIGKGGTAIWADAEIIATVNGSRAFHSIARANAQVMAAAPELLAALKTAQANCCCQFGDCRSCIQAEAAIAKAEGK